ncbi:MAG: MacB family efflux pump subunit [Bradyrhizobiaceae bacterium]|nr:MacB family efflux pump subunit [Bradyrhizobiaceae bacterium]
MIELENVRRFFPGGDTVVRALDGVSLSIEAGEFVAIMGPSGSGKSTLMNILGCLDTPTDGSYRVAGHDVAFLSPDELAALRSRTFGFVFQRFNLLPTITAAENVEIPAIYAGRPRRERMERAHALLARLGLGDRSEHRPPELSGGQQQRVSIARALINDAQVILADEPTGALDSRSGEEVLALLKELNAGGHTVLLITHDPGVAANARRIIRIADGRIVSDERNEAASPAPTPAVRAVSLDARNRLLPDLVEATKMALHSMRTNVFRTALTLLGVVIGVAAVVAMLAIGDGSRQQVLERISAMGTNLLVVRPGGPAIRTTGDNASLVEEDAAAIAELENVSIVSPERSSRATVRFGNIDYQTSIQGAWPGYTRARDWALTEGSMFSQEDVRSYAPVVVLGQTVVQNLFPNGDSPVGKYVLVRNVPFEVVGVLAKRGATPWGSDQDDVVLMPLSTGYMRIFGRRFVNSVTVYIEDVGRIAETEEAIKTRLIERHRAEDFRLRNTASILETAVATQQTLTILLGSVAAISLLVGGIGVMNIMLVSVTERTREIGVRMATGARRGNILLQFNTEAMVVCGIGGIVGVALGIGVALLCQWFGIAVSLSVLPAALAFSCAFLTGLLFGYLPARKAAHMDPVAALAYE